VIAVLGATGIIGHSLARKWAASRTDRLVLFARNPALLTSDQWPGSVAVRPIAEFDAGGFDLVVNAIGASDPTRVATLGADILRITREWDERVLATMGPQTRYVFLSSGAAYGDIDRPSDGDTALHLPVNRLESVSPYTLAKLIAEIGHRQAPERAILDLRIFGFADPGIPLAGTSFLADLARAVATGEPLLTSPDDMVRDYAGIDELHQLIERWVEAGAPNRACDLYTLAPLGKSELLGIAAERHGLKVRHGTQVALSPSGKKSVYASAYRTAAELGYLPQRKSLDVVIAMLDAVRTAAGRLPARSAQAPSRRPSATPHPPPAKN